MEEFIDIFNYLRAMGVVDTKSDFAAFIGANRGAVNMVLNRHEEHFTSNMLMKAKLALAEWRQANAQINVGTANNSQIGGTGNSLTINAPAAASNTEEHSLVPVVPYKVYQEVGVNLMDYLQRPELQRVPRVSQMAKADCHLFVHSDEMHPHLRPGDVLALKHVPEEAPIVNGEIYVVNSEYLGITIRLAYDRGDHLELRSSSSRFEPFDIPKSQVLSMFRILGLVRTNIY